VTAFTVAELREALKDYPDHYEIVSGHVDEDGDYWEENLVEVDRGSTASGYRCSTISLVFN
jgi:hypothetical protein